MPHVMVEMDRSRRGRPSVLAPLISCRVVQLRVPYYKSQVPTITISSGLPVRDNHQANRTLS